MIKSFIICDSRGYPFYSRTIDKDFKDIDSAMFSGLISAIGSVGKELFNEQIATITYGLGNATSSIVVVAKEFISLNKSIFFVFLVQGECNHVLIKQVSTSIFIETKNKLKNPELIKDSVKEKIDRIIESKFGGLNACG